MHDDSIADLEEAVLLVNSTLSGEIQEVDTGLTALDDTVAELEGRMENLEGELTSIEELISELESRLMRLEVAGILHLRNIHYKTGCPYQSKNSVVYYHLGMRIGKNFSQVFLSVWPLPVYLFFLSRLKHLNYDSWELHFEYTDIYTLTIALVSRSLGQVKVK